uniref:Uncharacterized protein n=1 Tax=Anguilla anguilla TaxID=7936 RepID=A0A0E9QKD7_ANGAN
MFDLLQLYLQCFSGLMCVSNVCKITLNCKKKKCTVTTVFVLHGSKSKANKTKRKKRKQKLWIHRISTSVSDQMECYFHQSQLT